MTELTKLFQHFIAFVQNEMFDFAGVENLVPREGIESSGSGHHDMRALGLVTEQLRILSHWGSTIERRDANVRHILGETRVLVLNLESELASVAKHENRDLAIHGLELLKRRQNKDGGFTVTRLRLAQDVHSQHSLGDALLLNCIKESDR